MTSEKISSGISGLGKLALLHPELGLEAKWNEDQLQLLGLAALNPPKEIWCHLVRGFVYCGKSMMYIVICMYLVFHFHHKPSILCVFSRFGVPVCCL